MTFFAMPCSILRISIWNSNLELKPHVHTAGKPEFLRHFNIFRIVVSVTYLPDKKKEGRLPIGWSVHDESLSG